MHAKSVWSESTQSLEAGRELASQIAAEVTGLKAIIVYATVFHDLPALLAGVKAASPAGTTVVGCSTQGLAARGYFREDGYLAGAIGLGGDEVSTATASAEEIQLGTFEKAQAMGRSLTSQLGRAPKAVVIYYDPLSRVDVPRLIAGFTDALPDATIMGGGAAQTFGKMVQTYQFSGDTVRSGACVVLAIDGPFDVLSGRSSGAESAGIEMRVTKVDGNQLLELDGRPALDVWLEMVGLDKASNDIADSASWAVGVRLENADAIEEGDERWTIMAAFGFDTVRRSVILQASVPESTRVLFHHRTVEAVSKGTQTMGARLRKRLGTRRPVAVLTFECGARVGPFLGQEQSLLENCTLQDTLAPDAAWLGMVAWGEIAPSPRNASFCNYTFPLLVFAEQ